MAASTTSQIPVVAPSPVEVSPVSEATTVKRRHITPEAGHALEILGHAIEYLSDELVHEGGAATARDGRVEAIQLLMALNRQVYFECPEVPTLRERLLRLFAKGSR